MVQTFLFVCIISFLFVCIIYVIWMIQQGGTMVIVMLLLNVNAEQWVFSSSYSRTC